MLKKKKKGGMLKFWMGWPRKASLGVTEGSKGVKNTAIWEKGIPGEGAANAKTLMEGRVQHDHDPRRAGEE